MPRPPGRLRDTPSQVFHSALKDLKAQTLFTTALPHGRTLLPVILILLTSLKDVQNTPTVLIDQLHASAVLLSSKKNRYTLGSIFARKILKRQVEPMPCVNAEESITPNTALPFLPRETVDRMLQDLGPSMSSGAAATPP